MEVERYCSGDSGYQIFIFIFLNNAWIDKLAKLLFQDYFPVYFFHHFSLSRSRFAFRCCPLANKKQSFLSCFHKRRLEKCTMRMTTTAAKNERWHFLPQNQYSYKMQEMGTHMSVSKPR